MDLCRFRDAFGKPNEGAHSARFMGLAALDLALTVFGAFALAGFRLDSDFVLYFALVWAVGVAAHVIFCVRTPITRALVPAGDE